MFQAAICNALFASILAGIAYLLTRIWRHPAVAHTLWLLVLLKLVTPTVLPFDGAVLLSNAGNLRLGKDRSATAVLSPIESNDAQSFRVQFAPAAVSTQDAIAQHSPASTRSDTAPQKRIIQTLPWMALLTSLWIVVSVAIGLFSLSQIVAFHRQMERASLPVHPRLTSLATKLSGEFGFRRAPLIRVVRSRVSPMVWTFMGRTYVIVPSELLEELNDGQVASLLAHEFAHIKRRDHWLRWLELTCITLYWWLPVTWWARRQLRRAEEECCDAVVATVLPQRRDAYVATLLKTVEFLLDAPRMMPATASGMGQALFLKRRCEMILTGTTAISRTTRQLLLLAALAILPFGISPGLSVAEGQSDPTDANAASQRSRNRSETPQAQTSSSTNHDTDFALPSFPSALNQSAAFASRQTEAGENESRAKTIPVDQRIRVGDLNLQLRELLSLESFVAAKRNFDFGALSFVDDNLVNASDELDPASIPESASLLIYERPSRVFTQVSYNRPSPHPDYFRFVVHGKYDAKLAQARLIEQLTEVLGQPSGKKRNQWHFGTSFDEQKLILEFRVDDKTGRIGPSLHIVVRHRPDW